MWPFKKKDPPATTIAINVDVVKLMGELRLVQDKAAKEAVKPPIHDDGVKYFVDKWIDFLPEAFERSLADDDEYVFLWDQGLDKEKFLYAAHIFVATVKQTLGLNADISTARDAWIKIKTEDLQKLLGKK